ncbi:MAG: 4Fe-4S dicluster domain-containing protein [Clostridia bacterium]|nr:4Fe-4S dicluster domain-containing protein [Clostridia bacterium]
MTESTRYHSVRLEKDRCRGCTNCLKHCPTEAIRVRGGRAHIIDNLCIDCGECIRICEYQAKVAVTDSLRDIERFKYRIALPAPTLYGQFRGLKKRKYVLEALTRIGFDGVFEVARGADVVTRAIRERIRDRSIPRPVISSACPAVVRLIQVRFPELLDHVIDIRQPMEVAASIARSEFCRKHGCRPEEVGCFFITPCPAKMTAIRNPIGQSKSELDGAISIMELYGLLLPHVEKIQDEAPDFDPATRYGVGWATSDGEATAVCPERSLSVDGIPNVIRVLEEVENNKLSDLEYLEGNACIGGCVGGALVFENNYVAKTAIRRLTESLPSEHPDQSVPASLLTKYPVKNDQPFRASAAMSLDENLMAAMQKMNRMNRIIELLPGYDCGSCGSPTCKAFAEDIVRGFVASEMECVHLMKNKLRVMAQEMVTLAQSTIDLGGSQERHTDGGGQ